MLTKSDDDIRTNTRRPKTANSLRNSKRRFNNKQSDYEQKNYRKQVPIRNLQPVYQEQEIVKDIHENCVDIETYHVMDKKLTKSHELNQVMIEKLKKSEREKGEMFELVEMCLEYIANLFDDMVNLPDEISVKKSNYDMANFSFDSKDKYTVKKESYIQHNMVTFIQKNTEVFNIFNFEEKIMNCLFKFENQKKESQNKIEPKETENLLKKSTLKEHLNVFKETLTASLNNSFSNQGSVLKKSNYSQHSYQSQPKEQQNEAKKEGVRFVDTNKLYKVLFDYTSKMEKDLQIRQGDIIRITRMYNNGWYRGVNIKTKEKGYVPSNFIKLIDESEIRLT